jgi:tetratricopeptide (TPR) repeat protein
VCLKQKPWLEKRRKRAKRVLKLSRTSLAFLLIGLSVPIGFMVRRSIHVRAGKPPEKAANSLTELAPCRLALTPAPGDTPMDAEIVRLQDQIMKSREPWPALERLGWLMVKKARLSFDNGYYKLAEQCAACLEATGSSKSPEALLLRAHVLQSLHRFNEAETLARDLLKTRERPFDYGVLGDVLVDQGKIREAAAAYQRMVDLRPDLQSYTRAAHIRWLTGDLAGARELMELATASSSPNDPEAGAWAYTRLALYQLQQDELKQAVQACNAALTLQGDYAPALLARAKILLVSNRSTEALSDLNKATILNPMVEYQWTLADTLLQVGDLTNASKIESQIMKTGATEDPRTFSLYLATRGENADLAIQLAQQELVNRRDIFTYDALAWALTAAGRIEEARTHIKQALSEGTHDARLYLHAGVIASLNNEEHAASRWFKKAYSMRQTLLPSERVLLEEWLERIRTRG